MRLAVSAGVACALLGCSSDKPPPHCTLADSYLPGLSGSLLVTADVDGDGNADLLSVGGLPGDAFQLTVARGKGDGTFADPQTQANAAYLGPWSAAVADFDRDGHLDLVAWSDGSASTSTQPLSHASLLVMHGNGDGTFAPPVATDMGQMFAASVMLAADFDRDGALDLAVGFGGSNGYVRTLRGMGNGTFAAPVDPGIHQPLLSVADVDGNGTADLTFGQVGYCDPTMMTCAEVTFAPGHGDGTFGTPVVTEPPGLEATIQVLADVDGDGHLDAVGTKGLGNPDGTFSVVVLLGHGDGTFSATPIETETPAPVTPAAADLDGDGATDVMYVSSGSIVVQRARRDGTFEAARAFAIAGGGGGVVSADFDHDGHLDLGAANTVLLGNGDGTFRSWETYAASYGPTLGAVDDFDGDGHRDVVLSTTGGIVALRGGGDGSLQRLDDLAPTTMIAGAGIGVIKSGHRGIVAATWAPGTLVSFVSTGPGVFDAPITTPIAGTPVPGATAILDLDGDHIVDAALGLADQTIALYYGDGHGAFTAGPTLSCGSQNGTIDAIDVDGDGLADLVACGQVFWRTAARVYSGGSPLPRFSVVGDLDADKHPDVVQGNGSFLFEYPGVGGRTFGDPVMVPTPEPVTAQLVSDLDNDGLGDVVASAFGTGMAYVFPGGAAPPIARRGLLLRRTVAADLDGDGGRDLITTLDTSVAVLRSICSP